jgi:hypothetical protein
MGKAIATTTMKSTRVQPVGDMSFYGHPVLLLMPVAHM